MRLCMAVGFQWRSWKLKIMQFNECTEKKKNSSAGIHINDTFFISKQVYYLMSNVYFL